MLGPPPKLWFNMASMRPLTFPDCPRSSMMSRQTHSYTARCFFMLGSFDSLKLQRLGLERSLGLLMRVITLLRTLLA